jgi:hypothetical protein
MAAGLLSRALEPDRTEGRNHNGSGPLRIRNSPITRSAFMTLGTILLIILVLLLLGALPTWGYSRGWGYGPSGILGLVLIVILILFLMGRI